MRKSKTGLIALIAITLCIGSAVALVFYTMSLDTWTVHIPAQVEAKSIHPTWTADVAVNYPDWTHNTAWYNGKPTSYILFGSNNVGNNIYITLSATGTFITNGGTVNAELIHGTAALSGGVITTETSLLNITNINNMTPYNIPTDLLTTNYPTANAKYLRINFTFNSTPTQYGDYDTNIQINLTDNNG